MERLLEGWGRFVARWPLVILLGWALVLGLSLHFAPSIQSVANKQNNSSLPTSAPSRRAETLYEQKFPGGQAAANGHEAGVIVLVDPAGISPADLSLAQRIAAYLDAPATRPAYVLSVAAPGPSAPLAEFESADRQALRLPITWSIDNDSELSSSVSAIDTYLARQPIPAHGTLGLVSSSAITRDFYSSLFGGLNIGVLVSLLIILLVLGYVYRSPLAVIVPLAVIGVVFELANGVIAWLGQTFGLPVATFSLQYVGFVLLGAGTNYGVFLLSRYREEIRRTPVDGVQPGEIRRAALARSVGRVGEAICSSALTVVAVTGIMGLGQLALLRETGPAVAVAVVCLLAAGISLLPALMALCGPALFWPVNPRPEGGAHMQSAPPTRGVWAFAGRVVTQRPWMVTVVTLLLLTPLALAALGMQISFDDLASLPASAPASQSYAAYQAHFSDSATAQVFISAPGHDLRQPQYAATLTSVERALRTTAHVSGAQGPTDLSLPAALRAQDVASDGSAVLITVTINVEPGAQAARDTVDALYANADHALSGTQLSGATVLIGGDSAGMRDEAAQMANDFILIIVVSCLAIYVILAFLLRSLTAPVYLIATIALSAGTAIGLTNLVYHNILGKPVFYLAPLFAFVFLVALGEDFNILTMARIREEVALFGQRRGVAAAVALTGGVVSSCGLVMAASFSRAIASPILELAESAFAITIGVLIDTFIVRPLLVPAIVMLLGRWNWVWPGRRAEASTSQTVDASRPAEQRADM